MLVILRLLTTFAANLFKSRRQLEVENLFLRHQLTIALRRAPRRLRLHGRDTAPRYLIRDNDAAYGRAFTNRIRTMGIRDRPIAPRSPWQNPYVERLIGTLRRECLDHVLIFGERHLHRVLTLYSLYYNETRTHLGLAKDAPIRRPAQRSGPIVTTPILSGLHHSYARI
jgi:transposase InsO family protein